MSRQTPRRRRGLWPATRCRTPLRRDLSALRSVEGWRKREKEGERRKERGEEEKRGEGRREVERRLVNRADEAGNVI